MAEINQVLSAFSFGEIDPKLAARVDFLGYNNGLKTATNVLSMPQGGVTRRWGTRYVATCTATNYVNVELYALVYDAEAVYCLKFENNTLNIYLENTLVATVVTTYVASVLQRLSFVQIQNNLLILHQNYFPAQLVRSAVAANIIAGVDATNNYITVTTGLVAGVIVAGAILPITFTTAGTLPTTTPQIETLTLYYARVIDNTHIRVYSIPTDASADINYYTITAVGAGVSNVIFQNTWTLANAPFSNLPAYDFDSFTTYTAAGFTFAADAVAGTETNPVTITASGAVFTAAHVGGVFRGNDGVMRITVFTDSTHVDGITYTDFADTATFPGRESFLGEPAWSTARGYPSCGTFFQERLFLAGSRQIPNGLWGSVNGAVFDFDDSESLDDNAISYYMSAGLSNYIRALTSSKSLIAHSNTGNYSTPLQIDVALTPSNFSLVEQNKDGISVVNPVFIDNQILYVDKSGGNLKSMNWDFDQYSYVNTNRSIYSSHLVLFPFDMAVYTEPEFTDGYYIMLINNDGSIGIYDSLEEQEIKGWTRATTSQNIVNPIIGYTAQSYFTITNPLPVSSVFPVTFTTVGTFPTTVPQIAVDVTYYIRAVTVDQVLVFTTEEEALNWNFTTNNTGFYEVVVPGVGVSNIVISDTLDLEPNGYFRRIAAGLNRCWVVVERVIGGSTVLYLEELDFDYPVDSGVSYSFTTPTDTLTGLTHLNNQTVQIFADGVVLPPQKVTSNQLELDVEVSEAKVGLGFTSVVEMLPVNLALGTGPSLYQEQHIRNLYVHYLNTVGAKVQSYLIPTQETQEMVLDQLAVPGTGVYAYTLMEGWDGFEYTIRIIQDSPLPFTLLGVGYDVEVK